MGMDPPPPQPPSLHADAAGDRRRCREYLLALEEERRKIQVFQRELPLCLDLVTQTIERIKLEMDGVGSEETVSDRGPVLEEFMPLKPSLSLSSSEEHDSARDASGGGGNKAEAADKPCPLPETKKATPDWLQSVQLWSQEPQHQRTTCSSHKELPCKPVALNARKAGGAFQPFEKEKRVEMPASSTTAATSSTVAGDSGDKADASMDTEKHSSDDKETTNKDATGKDKEGQSPSRKLRRCWSPELHRLFLQALQQLGGAQVATPKQIRELMKVEGLTNDEVKSHLQKYRLHTRRPNSTVPTSSTSAATPAPQVFVVGGIWVPPPEYAVAAAAAAAAAHPPVQQPTADASGGASTVYAPVATLPSGAQTQSRELRAVKKQPNRFSDGRSAGDASSASPAVSSSSSQTTSA